MAEDARPSGAKYLTLNGSVKLLHLVIAVGGAIVPAIWLIARMPTHEDLDKKIEAAISRQPTEARIKEMVEDRAPWARDKGRVEAELSALRSAQAETRASIEAHAREEGHPALVVERVRALKGQVDADRAASEAQGREQRATMKALSGELRDAVGQLQQLAAELRAEQRAERQLKEALIKRVESIEDRLRRSQPGKGIAPPKDG